MITLLPTLARSARSLPAAATLAVSVALGVTALPAAAQLGLPDSIVQSSSGSFSADEQQQIIQYINSHAAGLTGDWNQISTSRKRLLSPLRGNVVSTPFRTFYADRVLQKVTPLIPDARDEVAINAARVAGELGTPASIDALRPALADKRPAVRIEAAFALERVFAIARDAQGVPVLLARDVGRGLGHLTEAFAAESEPLAADALVVAMSTPIQITEDKILGVRNDAAVALARAVSARVKDPAAESFTAAFGRASRALLDPFLNVNPNAALSTSAIKEAAGTAGDLLAWASRRVTAAGGPPAEPELTQLRLIVAQLEVLIARCQARLDGRDLSSRRLADSLRSEGGEVNVEQFRRGVQEFLGPDGILTKAPFGFAADRFR